MARTRAQGRACGLSSVLGVALGNLANGLGAALRLAALFAVSSAAFAHSLRRVFRDGFLVALLNPKTSLFFAAFLPQFMDAHGANPLLQTLALGGVFVAIACCTDVIYVLTASLVAPRLGRAASHRRWGNRLAGTSFIGLGVLTAMGSRASR